ncbi:hypothetical protein Hanom_Chr05g00457741 [Helianthus anomalus]
MNFATAHQVFDKIHLSPNRTSRPHNRYRFRPVPTLPPRLHCRRPRPRRRRRHRRRTPDTLSETHLNIIFFVETKPT